MTPRQFHRMFTLMAAVLAAGCGDSSSEADLDTSRPAEFGYQVTPRTVRLIEGRQAYERYCIGCHGPEGDGNGEAARFLYPRPRNFQQADFKFMSTRFGELPTDDDLYRTLTHGLRGTSMPSWGHLPEQTRWALIEYIKTFSDAWENPPTAAIALVADPYASDEDKTRAIARGEMAYHGYFNCWNCHPAYVPTEKLNEYIVATGGTAREAFRANLDRSAIKTDSKGKTIFAPDFRRDYVKSGTSVHDLYRSIGAGITGTAMPTWIDAAADGPVDADGDPLASREDIWAIAYYVQDLIKKRQIKFDPDDVVLRADRAMTFSDVGMDYVATETGAPLEGQEFLEEAEFFEEEDG